MSEQIQVLLLIYPGFNTLDLNGPLEVLRSSTYPIPGPFATQIAAEAEDDIGTTAYEGITVKRNLSLIDAIERIAEWEVLIIVGAPTNAVLKEVKRGGNDGVGQVLEAFMRLGAFPDGKERVMLSICTGALIPGALGVFDGMSATTHHLALQTLSTLCQEYVASHQGTAHGTKVVRQRYVDAGWNEKGTRIISAGGVSSGIDATMYLVKEKIGREIAEKIADAMEYAWREVKEPAEIDYAWKSRDLRFRV